ncbi:MAG: hypothetical protein PHN46_04755 [Eubacteriales bacterium]|jgi:hypothetical protein|nr:hypothetical protein [Eubacteriales bacterium]MDD4134373.1 hypothetical protein [Eubacteriales bacterium]
MKTNLRKEASLGVILLAVYLIIRIFFNGSGFFMWILGIAGLALLVIGILPENLHRKVLDIKNRLTKKA